MEIEKYNSHELDKPKFYENVNEILRLVPFLTLGILTYFIACSIKFCIFAYRKPKIASLR